MLNKLLEIIRIKLFFKQKPKPNLSDYWKDRAIQYGRRSVLNIAHADDQFDLVTNNQKQILFPLLKSELSGKDKKLLDFGCGPGRFTNDLAELIQGTSIGVDITRELLELAPKSQITDYIHIEIDTLPFSDSSFDIVWSCLVLGGIPNEDISNIISEIERVLRPGGLFFYVENTANEANSDYWFFRDQSRYRLLASFCNPRVISSYEDIGQTITVFAGRKPKI